MSRVYILFVTRHLTKQLRNFQNAMFLSDLADFSSHMCIQLCFSSVIDPNMPFYSLVRRLCICLYFVAYRFFDLQVKGVFFTVQI